MRNLVNTFLFCVLMVGFASCSGEASTDSAVSEGVAKSTVCCSGNCEAPAGTCCNDDGTCGGNHVKLPLAKNQ
ncbi:MAG TPA: hypothetical protein EYN86_02305 [Planctomycetes bacterium]|nr:hypothetical protein [Planctomycetota bacterium]